MIFFFPLPLFNIAIPFFIIFFFIFIFYNKVNIFFSSQPVLVPGFPSTSISQRPIFFNSLYLFLQRYFNSFFFSTYKKNLCKRAPFLIFFFFAPIFPPPVVGNRRKICTNIFPANKKLFRTFWPQRKKKNNIITPPNNHNHRSIICCC